MSEECPNHHTANRLIQRSMSDNNMLKTLTVVWKEDRVLQDMQLEGGNLFEQACKIAKVLFSRICKTMGMKSFNLSYCETFLL